MVLGIAGMQAEAPPSAQPPVLGLTPADVQDVVEALDVYCAQFAPLFRRSEQRQWARKYLEGQLLDLERKSIEPMALALAGGNVQAMQQFISAGGWDDEAVLSTHQRLVADTLGDATTGVLILDGCDFPKQGAASVGVARQWCGALGKVANCQAGVLAAYAGAAGYTLVDRRLYLPQAWFDAAHAGRRQACGVPPETPFRTKPELAWEMLCAARERGSLSFRYVTMDEGFGRNTTLLDQVSGAGLSYLAEVPHDTEVWQERPLPPAEHRIPGVRLIDPPPMPERVDRLAYRLPPVAWRPETIKQGSKGPIQVQVACLRVVARRDDRPGPAVWLLVRRGLQPDAELKTYLCNAPTDTPRRTLIWLLGMRWPIELAIRECKDELGMDQYEVRGWRGWHHHLTMTLLAHHFLVWQRMQLGGKITRLDPAPGALPAHRPPAPASLRRGDRPRPPALPAGTQLCGCPGPPSCYQPPPSPRPVTT
jgi:SRSO17 transposase